MILGSGIGTGQRVWKPRSSVPRSARPHEGRLTGRYGTNKKVIQLTSWGYAGPGGPDGPADARRRCWMQAARRAITIALCAGRTAAIRREII